VSPTERKALTSASPKPRPNCCLCAQIQGLPDYDLLHRLLGGQRYERRIVLESAAAAVIPSLGPLAPGHLLICPKDHHRSLAAAPADTAASIRTLADRASELLADVYDAPPHRFEHGDATAGHDISCSVEHAHLHLLPTSADPWARLRDELDWQVVARAQSLGDLTVGREYLYYERPDGSAYLHVAAESVPSQLLRLRFAEAIGDTASWNWRTSPRAERANACFRRLRQATGATA
jgi:ATP adenylyltransferase